VFERELAYFIKNQERLVSEFRGKVLIIREDNVVGVHDTTLHAYLEAEARFKPGSYMIQPCEPGPSAYTVDLTASGPQL
jgi:hypothetical protein